MLKIIFIFIALIVVMTRGNSMVGNFNQCSLQCSNNGDVPIPTANHQSTSHLIRGKSGPRGQKGDQGPSGVKGHAGKNCDVTELATLQSRITELESDAKRKFNNSQNEVAHLKEYVTTLEGQLNNTLHELVDNLKIELTILNETLVNTLESLKNATEIGRTCKALLDNGQSINGVYTITGGSTPFQTYCDMDTGGYIVFQRRYDGSTNFTHNFQTYINGFGSLNAEYWLGLEKLHQLTNTGRWQLRVDLQAYDNDEAYALYDDFSIGAAPGYKLHVGTYSGTAGDTLKYHNGMAFSSYDHDADEYGPSCAVDFQGAWWYHSCHKSNLNAFNYDAKIGGKEMRWVHFKGADNPMKTTTMMVREI